MGALVEKDSGADGGDFASILVSTRLREVNEHVPERTEEI